MLSDIEPCKDVLDTYRLGLIKKLGELRECLREDEGRPHAIVNTLQTIMTITDFGLEMASEVNSQPDETSDEGEEFDDDVNCDDEECCPGCTRSKSDDESETLDDEE